MQMVDKRQSNMELFRIVSMLLVLLVHAAFLANGLTSFENIRCHPFDAFIFSEMEALSLVCVNCFVIISGYFGIKPTWRGICKLLFIVYFWRFSIYFCDIVFGHGVFTLKEFLFNLNLFSREWFVGSYIGLYVFAIFINGFIENSDKNKFRNALLIYWSLQFIVGWFLSVWPNSWLNFGNGYTVLSLIGIYMLGRYIRLYVEPECQKKKTWLICGYFAFATLNALIFLISIGCTSDFLLGDMIVTWFVSYNSFFTVAATVCHLLFFSKIKISNRSINFISTSAFSVYLIHMNPHILPYYLYCARWLKSNLNIFEWVPAVIGFAVLVYLLCFVVDRPRVWLWRYLENRFLFKPNI